MDLSKLYRIICNRIEHKTQGSYVSALVQSGTDRIIQKIGEEATEVVIAAKNSEKSLLICESVDLIFHLMVLLAVKGISLTDLQGELNARSKSHEQKS